MDFKPTAAMNTTEPIFWRDSKLPFLEARSIEDGRKICYARHSHETFSIGVITGGHCNYLNGTKSERIGAGSVVLMNPGDVHACNPLSGEPWSYIMLYADVSWLSAIQCDHGVKPDNGFAPFSATSTTRPELGDGLTGLFETLINPDGEPLQKHSAAVSYMSLVQQSIGKGRALCRAKHPKLGRAAEFIRQNYQRSLKLEELCAEVNLSASHLIRAFKDVYGLTPHAYVTNCRIEYCRSQLRLGRPIADVAVAAGFADQAHMQRSFKKLVAATPGQYRA
jgi:AraC-like DNA-binding protein